MYVVFVGKEENGVKTPLECNLRDTLKDVYSEGNSVLSQSIEKVKKKNPGVS
jgi:hypothetical protein